ncbi:hypothetical protein SDC9_158640 [bioreactor metagenome]|uniref:Uncharacterized protein n=1 Tax=bioreactor metagenome TaxID=1076179 RepID=A0A645FD85_9ZZZZ
MYFPDCSFSLFSLPLPLLFFSFSDPVTSAVSLLFLFPLLPLLLSLPLLFFSSVSVAIAFVSLFSQYSCLNFMTAPDIAFTVISYSIPSYIKLISYLDTPFSVLKSVFKSISADESIPAFSKAIAFACSISISSFLLSSLFCFPLPFPLPLLFFSFSKPVAGTV